MSVQMELEKMEVLLRMAREAVTGRHARLVTDDELDVLGAVKDAMMAEERRRIAPAPPQPGACSQCGAGSARHTFTSLAGAKLSVCGDCLASTVHSLDQGASFVVHVTVEVKHG